MFGYMNQQLAPPVKQNEQPYYYYPTWPVSQEQENHHHYHEHQPSPSLQHHHQPFVAEQPSSQSSQQASPAPHSKITQSVWEDQNTFCFQVDAQGICVARRQDNDMVNGTKLLNVTGISRGKRDGILKNENGRVVVKVGAMHLKGVWITFTRAKALAAQFNIEKLLHPLFEDDPTRFYEQQQQPSLPHQHYMNPPFYLSPTPPQQQDPMIATTPNSLATLTTTSTSSLDLAQIQHYPYSYPDEWELSLVLNSSSVLSDSAPGTPDVANMFPPQDTSAAALTFGFSPYPFSTMMDLPQAADDDLYYYYQR